MNELIKMAEQLENMLREKEEAINNADVDSYVIGRLNNVRASIVTFRDTIAKVPNDPTLKSTVLGNFTIEKKRIEDEMGKIF